MPIRDGEREYPVAHAWRPTFRKIVSRIVAGDYELRGIPGVTPLRPDEGIDLFRDRVANYGNVTLVELPDATWDTSVAMWDDPSSYLEGGFEYWDVLIDLHTAEEGRSDLVLGARVIELSGRIHVRRAHDLCAVTSQRSLSGPIASANNCKHSAKAGASRNEHLISSEAVYSSSSWSEIRRRNSIAG